MIARLRGVIVPLLVAIALPCRAQSAPVVELDFKSVSVAQVIQLIYSDVFSASYVLEPEVLTDSRMVSFRYTRDKGDVRAFVKTFLGALGYGVESRNGVDLIAKAKEQDRPEAVQEDFVYRPKYRDVNYLARLLGPVFHGTFIVNRSIPVTAGVKSDSPAPAGSAAALLDQNADVLVFRSTPQEIEKLKVLLAQVDFAVGEVAVRGVVYEVSDSSKSTSAFGLLANVLAGKLSIGIGPLTSMGNVLTFKNTALEAIFTALSTDSRFRVLSSPSLRIRSGSVGSFSVGEDVPVLGAVSYTQATGQPVQSVEYRASGVLFDVRPTVRDGEIELQVAQQLSNFVATTTGVNSSPTLIKRSLKTSVGLQPGDGVVLGGLTQDKETHGKDGLPFLPDFLSSKSGEKSSTEILLLLQVQRI